jgi:hypothetical protein
MSRVWIDVGPRNAQALHPRHAVLEVVSQHLSDPHDFCRRRSEFYPRRAPNQEDRLLLAVLLMVSATPPEAAAQEDKDAVFTRELTVDVQGDDGALAPFLHTAMWDAWRLRPSSAPTALHVVVRVDAAAPTTPGGAEATSARVTITDGEAVLAAVRVEATDADLLHARVWLVVKSTIERALREPAAAASAKATVKAPKARAPSPMSAMADATAPAPTTQTATTQTATAHTATARATSAIGVGLRAVVDGMSLPSLGASISLRADAASWARWSVDAGYAFRSYGESAGAEQPTPLVLHALPVAASAALVTDARPAGMPDVSVAVGVRAAAALTFASAPHATTPDGRSAFGVTAGLGPMVRVDAALVDDVGLFGEVALEARAVRQAWRVETARFEEPLLAVPILAGLEWRW